MRTQLIWVLSLLAVAGSAMFGCGSSGETDSETAAPASGSATMETTVADDRPQKGSWGVAFGAESEDLGIILYDLSGHTLYTYSRDGKGASRCYGACAETWPPALTEGKPRADGAASSKMIGTTKRKDGTIQLTYAGHPLYRYSQDRSAEIDGNGVKSFGGEWYAIRPNGERP